MSFAFPYTRDDAAMRRSVSKELFFRRLLVESSDVQVQVAASVAQELEQMLQDADPTMLYREYYPTAARMAKEAPFRAIRDALAPIVDNMKDQFAHLKEDNNDADEISASYFVDAKELPTVESLWSDAENESEAKHVVAETFLSVGRLTHFTRVLSWHPSYLQLFQASLSAIMMHEGTLPLAWRSYISILACAEQRCHYLADMQQSLFLVNGGEPAWVKGIEHVPSKLFQLHELSALLAHRPWLLTKDHIADLLFADQEESWSVSELVHAIIVLCQYHSMSSIAHGMGMAEEPDLASYSDYGSAGKASPISSRSSSASPRQSGENDAALMNASDFSLSEDTIDESSAGVTEMNIAEMDREDDLVFKRLRSCTRDGSETAEDDDDDGLLADIESDMDYIFEVAANEEAAEVGTPSSKQKDALRRFCGGSVSCYSDFDVRSGEYDVLHTEDFSWDEHCFSLVRRYFPGDTGQILEDLFDLTGKLTYDYFGHEKREVDTSPYRSAIWYYVHRIFGIFHDDYDYRQVNLFLNTPTKIFVKKVACTPWRVTREDFEHFDHSLSPPEKCHVTLIVAEARKQAGLMYALRAVMNHMR